MKNVIAYLAAIVLANLAIAKLGPAAAPGIAFLLIGLDLSLRDRLHDRWRRDNLALRMFGLIVLGGVLSVALNPAAVTIAVASSVAFMAAAAADGLGYHLLREKVWFTRANGSNLVGAAVDSVVFPWIAFGGLNWQTVGAMFLAKVVGGAVWSGLMTERRA